MGKSFKEIEHKYVVDDKFDKNKFLQAARGLKPTGVTCVNVQDTYYILKTSTSHIYRHRIDSELQQLTVKTLEDDSEYRVEINLDLGLHEGNQKERVNAFLDTFGIKWQGIVTKDVNAFYFDNCEIVFYEASFGGKKLSCVEFEATEDGSLEKALQTLRTYEQKLGFDAKDRTKESLFHLLIYPTLAEQIR